MSRLRVDVLIFDIDGVLIDVSASYRDAIRQTVQLYLQAVLGLAAHAGEIISPGDVSAFKLAGGFNNDWDLTTGVLKYLLALLPPVPVPARELPKSTADVLAYLNQIGRGTLFTLADLARQKNIHLFTQQVASAGGGLNGAWEVLGDRNDHLLFAEGDPRGTNLVKRIFEEVYLGEEYFANEYGEPPIVFHGPGLIRRERRIVTPSTLDALRSRMILGIATGRPRNQARYALETAGIAGYFRTMVTHEDIAAAQTEAGNQVRLGKPHPFTLLEAVRRITTGHMRCAYVGDTLDDIRAANAAKSEMDFLSIACLAPAEDKAAMRSEFERIGADLILDHPDELVAGLE